MRILNPFPYLVVQSLQDSHCAKGPKLAQLSSHGAPICSSPLNAHDIKSWVRGLQKELFDKFHRGSKAPIAKLITGNNPVNESSIVAVLTKCHIHPDIDNFGQFVTRIILKHREFTSGCHILRYKSFYGCVKGDIQWHKLVGNTDYSQIEPELDVVSSPVRELDVASSPVQNQQQPELDVASFCLGKQCKRQKTMPSEVPQLSTRLVDDVFMKVFAFLPVSELFAFRCLGKDCYEIVKNVFLVLLRWFSLSPDFVPSIQQYLVLQELHRVVSKEPERTIMRFPMVWEVNDGEGMDDFNACYGWKHEDEGFDDDSRQYIKSTVAVDFLPYVGLLVQHWPSVCATGTKNTTGFLRCPCHCNFKYDEKKFKFKDVSFECVDEDDFTFYVRLDEWRDVLLYWMRDCKQTNTKFKNDGSFLAHCCRSSGVSVTSTDGLFIPNDVKITSSGWLHIVSGLFVHNKLNRGT